MEILHKVEITDKDDAATLKLLITKAVFVLWREVGRGH